jgi:hypothetical protein
MAAKLLFSARCDAQLQGCIGQCFAAARMNRGLREGRDLRDLRDRDPREFREMRGSPDMRGPPDRGPPGPPVGRPLPDRGPPDMRGPPPRDFRDQRGPRWLGGRGLWDRR